MGVLFILAVNTVGRRRRRHVLVVCIQERLPGKRHSGEIDRRERSGMEPGEEGRVINVSFSRDELDTLTKIQHHYDVDDNEIIRILLKVGLEVLVRQVTDEIHKHLVDVSRTEPSGSWERFDLL